jgi:small conductance mechanosensitive channel
MDNILQNDYVAGAIAYSEKFFFALVVLIVGIFIIRTIINVLQNNTVLAKIDPTVKNFALSATRIGLYAVLFIAVIGILGVPMASVITVLASAGLAVGLALQGTLSNLAGGVMLLILRPFNVGDYVAASGAEGTIKEVNLFYTIFVTVDAKVITVPNSSIMAATITNFSRENLRRVDLSFNVAKTEEPKKIQSLLLAGIEENALVLKDPAPFARLSGATNEAASYSVRAWVKNEDYWTVYFDLTQSLTERLAAASVEGPALRVKEVK